MATQTCLRRTVAPLPGDKTSGLSWSKMVRAGQKTGLGIRICPASDVVVFRRSFAAAFLLLREWEGAVGGDGQSAQMTPIRPADNS